MKKRPNPKRSRIARSARRKGSSNEREVAKILQEWWGEGTFSRVPLSGGWANRKEFETCGDIICSDREFPFSVEIKARQGWMLEQLLRNPKCAIWSWWKQCEDECHGNKQPLLIFTKNRFPYFCMLKIEQVPNYMVFTDVALTFRGFCIIKLDDFIKLTDRKYWIYNPTAIDIMADEKDKSDDRPKTKRDSSALPEQLVLPTEPTKDGNTFCFDKKPTT